MPHVIVVDLGFGDAGKGATVDRLCARGPEPVHAGPFGSGSFGTGSFSTGRFHTVVRFNGGAQAAHNVVADDGRHHTFAQFGSGTFTPGVRTHLSRFMLVDPLALAAEAAHLRAVGVPDALDRLTVDEDALLTTPYHRAANRARETARGADRHGSCGMGVGETAAYALEHGDALRAGDCLSPARLRRGLERLRDWYLNTFPSGEPVPSTADCAEAFSAFAERVRIVPGEHLHGLLRAGSVVFEGAQGVLLDEWHGFHPYTTWSTTTFANAETLLAEAGGSGVRLGVLRAYATRHGPGPFVTEDPVLTAELPDPHNGTGRWQGVFRVGHLDAVALGYALEAAGGVDALAVTHLDVAEARDDLLVCRAYDIGGERVERLPAGSPGDLERQAELTRRLLAARPVYEPFTGIEDVVDAPVVMRSYGPRRSDAVQRSGSSSMPSRP
ncbi:adenylosuccinate synthetase [Spirillospora sp. NPDC050679]